MGLIFIAGKDPATSIGGHSTYVRAHALAAIAAGFAPQIFCVARRAGRVETEFGTLHRVASPLPSHRHPTMVVHTPFLAAAIRRWAAAADGAGGGGSHLVHAFGPWGYAGAAACRALARRGTRAVLVTSAYTTLAHDWRGKLAGLAGAAAHAGRPYAAAGSLSDATTGSPAAAPASATLRRLRYLAEYAWIRGVAARCERRGYERSRLVLVNYDSVRRLLVETEGMRVDVRRLPYAAAAAFRADAGAPTGEVPVAGAARPASPPPLPPPSLAALAPAAAPLIMTLARHDPRKGLDVLLRVLAALRHEGVGFRACLVGPGTLLERHRALARELGLDGCTVLVGRVGDPMDYLRHADLVVLPSLEEGSGSVALLEALQAGCAVVASDCDGIPEDLTDGDNALLVPPGDAAALHAALATALADAALRRRLAVRARATYEACFSPERLVTALAATYAELGFSAAAAP